MFSDLNPLDRSTALIEIAAMLLVAALIGFLTAWFIRKAMARKASPEEEQSAAARARQQAAQAAQDKAEQAKIRQAMAGLEKQVQTLEREKAALDQRIKKMDEALKKAEAAANQPPVSVSTTTTPDPKRYAEVEQLRSEKQGLEGQLEALKKENATLAGDLKTLRNRNAELQSKAGAAPATEAGTDPAVQQRLRDAEHKLRDMQRTQLDLQTALNKAQAQVGQLEAELQNRPKEVVAAAPLTPDAEAMQALQEERDALAAEVESLEAQLARRAARKKQKVVAEKKKTGAPDFAHLGTAAADAKDDLKAIEGITPEIETQLHAWGILTYKQLSKLTDADMRLLDERLALFPGRVKRERWAKQAKKISKSGN